MVPRRQIGKHIIRTLAVVKAIRSLAENLHRFLAQAEDMLTKDKLDDFLTSVCYPHILTTKYEGDIIPEDDLVSKL